MEEKKNDYKDFEEFFWHLAVTNKYRYESKDQLEFSHYTSVDGFKGIIEDGKIWGTRYDCLNDKTERQDIDNIFRQVIDELSLENDFYKQFEGVEIHNEYYLYYEDADVIKSKKIENPEIFVVSFSLDFDSLPMWTYYTKNIKNEGFQLKFCDVGNEIDNGGKCIITKYKLLYDEDEKKNYIKTILKDCKKYYVETEKNKELLRFIEQLIFGMFTDVFKNKYFKNEEEYRFLIIQDSKNRKYPVEYRIADGALIPYIEVPIEHIGKLIGVILSPKQNKDRDVLLTEEFLKSKKYNNVKVEYSNIPLK